MAKNRMQLNAARSSDRKKNKKSGSKKSINQALGIGKPGPHLLEHNRRKEAKKTKKAISKTNMGESSSSRESSTTPRLPMQHPRRTPQHRHHVLDHVAHTGTYLDEYDQDLQYQYSPGLWQKPAHSNHPETDMHSPLQHQTTLPLDHSVAGSLLPPHHVETTHSLERSRAAGRTYPLGSRINPYEISNEERIAERAGLHSNFYQLQHKDIKQRQRFPNSVERQTTKTAVSTVPEPEPVLISIPSVADLHNMHLERIKERNKRLKTKKSTNASIEVAQSQDAQNTNRRLKGQLKGQDRLHRISRLLRNTTDDLQQGGFEQGSDFIRLDAGTPAPALPPGAAGTLKRRRWHEDGYDTQGSTGPPPGCPWMRHRQYSNAPSAPLLLNHEVKDFVAFLSPTQEEHQVRTYVYERVKRAIKELWGDTVVKLFGSFETQLYLPTSDLDIVVFREEAFVKSDLTNLTRHLERTKVGTNFEVISNAKVPLIKLKESISEISVDISFNVLNGVDGAVLTKRFMEDTPGLRSLTILVKHFLKVKRNNEPFHGGVGSFLTVIMVLSFLQMHPKVQGRWIDPEENLGVLLIEFFELYGLNFNYRDVGLTVADGGRYFLKDKEENEKRIRFHALDPNDSNNNVGFAARNIDSIRVHFAAAFDSLVLAVEERDRYLRMNGYDANAPKVSLIKGVLNIPSKTMEHRFHMETVYNAGTFKHVLSRW
ncbi:hypothetical protein BGX26_011356 [Mortierella sp. AD094]|nr:hypothetical protein BGX26_011356 [Mortierella sp. AD094]